MRPVITLFMFLACLAYSSMPASAGCRMLMQPSATVTHAGHKMSARTVLAMVDMPSSGHGQDQPPDGQDGMTHLPFCAACLVLAAHIVIDADKALIFSYPAPARDAAMLMRVPAPPAPPPRA